MSTTWSVALAGFNPAERSSLENLLQMAGKQGPAFTVVTELQQAQVVIANADDPVMVRRVRALNPVPKVLLIGLSAGDTGWPLQGRPIKLLGVLDALRRLVEPPAVAAAPAAVANFEKTQPFVRGTAAAAPSPTQFAKTQAFSAAELRGATQGGAPAGAPAPAADPAAFAKTVAFQAGAQAPDFAKTVSFQSKPPAASPSPSQHLKAHAEEDINADDLARWRQAHPAPAALEPEPGPAVLPPTEVAVSRTAEFGQSSSGFLGINDKFAAPPAPAQPLGEALVVDEGELSRASTQRMLHRNGYHSDPASTGDHAVALASARPYNFVFIDEIGGAMGAHQVCRAVRQTKGAGGKRPTVVMLSSRGGAIDKLKAKLAGCDIYIVKPMKEDDLLAVLDRSVKRGLFG